MLRNPILMLALLAFLVPALATAAVEDPRDPTHHFFDPTFGEFPEELEDARAAGKKGILIFFEMADCPFCHRMKNQVLNQPEVQEYFSEHFRVFSVDVEGAIEIVTFEGETKTQMDWATRDYRVRATRNLYEMVGKLGRMWLRKTPLVVGSERIAEIAQELGFKAAVETAEDPTDAAMLAAVHRLANQLRADRA